jgi:hypothetical protein
LRQYQLADEAQAENKKTPKNSNARLADPATICMDYAIKTTRGKNIAWKPKDVYSAAGKTYIIMPEKMKVTEAPIFFIKQNGREKLANYRVEGNIYVVDRLFDVGILTVGKDRVAIYRKNPTGKPEIETPAARTVANAPQAKKAERPAPAFSATTGSKDIIDRPEPGTGTGTEESKGASQEKNGEENNVPASKDWQSKWSVLLEKYELDETSEK